MNIKIGILADSFSKNKCGVADYTYNLILNLLTHNITPVIFTFDITPFKIKNVDIKILKTDESIIKVIETENIKCLNIQYEPNLFSKIYLPKLIANIKKRLKIPVLTTFHTPASKNISSILKGSLIAYLSNRIIVTNEQDYFYLGLLPFVKNKCDIIYLGSNVPFIKYEKEIIKSEFQIKEDTKILIHFGIFYPGKGHKLIIDALKILRDKGYKIKVCMCGIVRKSDKKYFSELTQYIKSCNLENYFIIKVNSGLHTIAKLFTLSDIAVFPYEKGVTARRTTVAAALLYKVPCITTYSKFLPEYLINNETCSIINPNNLNQLVDSIINFIKNNDSAEKLAKNAYNQYIKNLDWNVVSKKYSQLILKLI